MLQGTYFIFAETLTSFLQKSFCT